MVSVKCWICSQECSFEDNFCRTCGAELSPQVGTKTKPLSVDRQTTVGVFLVAFGGITAAASLLIGVIPTLALGLSALLIGLMTLYLPESEQELAERLAADSSVPALLNIEYLLDDVSVNGKGIYIPSSGLGVCPKVFVPLMEKTRNKMPPRELNDSRRVFITLDKKTGEGGLLFEAPGRDLLSELELVLKLDFSSVEAGSLGEKLESGLRLLEISKSVNIASPEPSTFNFQLELITLGDLEVKLARLVPRVAAQIGTPVPSAIASAVSKSTGRYLTIKDVSIVPADKKVTATLELIQ